MSEPVQTLSQSEQEALALNEKIISQGLRTFVDVGLALRNVRDSRLYRDGFKTFEEYLLVKWGIRRQRAYDMISNAEAVSEISDKENLKESHARELSTVEPGKRSEVWEAAKEISNGKPTAEDVRTVAQNLAAEVKEPVNESEAGKEPLPPTSPPVVQVVDGFSVEKEFAAFLALVIQTPNASAKLLKMVPAISEAIMEAADVAAIKSAKHNFELEAAKLRHKAREIELQQAQQSEQKAA